MKYINSSHMHRGIHALHIGLVSGLAALLIVTTGSFAVLAFLQQKRADAAVSSFSSGSFWNAGVPTYTDLHPSSEQLVGDIVRQVGQYGAAFQKDNGSSPVYAVDNGVPTVAVEPWDCGRGIIPGLADLWQAVPIPFYAVPSGGANPQMVIYQNGMVWEFGHMRKTGAQWQACTGGRIATASSGVFASPFGVSASGLALLGGQVSITELQSGQINHVVGLTVPQVNSHVSPATQTSGGIAGAPPMGLRLRLDPGLSVESLGLHPVAKMIAKAAQTYGFIVWESGGSVGVTGENSISHTTRGLPDPYTSIMGGANGYGVLAGFPWDKLQALPVTNTSSEAIPRIHSFTTSSNKVNRDSTVTLKWSASNVSRCTIPNLADNLPASGSIITGRLLESTSFIIRCGGPSGTSSSQVTVTVTSAHKNDAQPTLDAELQLPYSGYANVIMDLLPPEVAARVYKVVYYEDKSYLFETAKPPFALNTERMKNGKHTLTAHLYFRDGGSEQKTVGITVLNTPETLFATTQSGIIKAPIGIPPLLGAAGLIASAVFVYLGTRWGWHRAHSI